MEIKRHIRLFQNGRNQVLMIPRDLEIKGKEAVIRKQGNRLIVEPVEKKGLLSVLAGLKPLNEHFPGGDDALLPLDDIKL